MYVGEGEGVSGKRRLCFHFFSSNLLLAGHNVILMWTGGHDHHTRPSDGDDVWLQGKDIMSNPWRSIRAVDQKQTYLHEELAKHEKDVNEQVGLTTVFCSSAFSRLFVSLAVYLSACLPFCWCRSRSGNPCPIRQTRPLNEHAH